MKILILPLILIFLSAGSFFCLMKYSERLNNLSFLTKCIMAVLFMATGLILSYSAILLSIEGMSEKGIQCMTGIAFFIPVGFLVNVIGIPALLFSKKSPKII